MNAGSKRLALWIARRPALGPVVGWTLSTNLPLPLTTIQRTKRVIVFKHPVPMRAGHLLIVPRFVCRSVFELLVPQRDDVLSEVISVAETLQSKMDQPHALMINFGCRQDVMQAHFHFVPCAPRQPSIVGPAEPDAGDIHLQTIADGQFHMIADWIRTQSATAPGGTLYFFKRSEMIRCQMDLSERDE